jgi:predicted DNA-binding protein
MPKRVAEYPYFTGARFSRELMDKLAQLSEQTDRPVADVLRALVRNATVGAPDLQTTVTAVSAGEGPGDAG